LSLQQDGHSAIAYNIFNILHSEI